MLIQPSYYAFKNYSLSFKIVGKAKQKMAIRNGFVYEWTEGQGQV